MTVYDLVIAVSVLGLCAICIAPLLMKKPCTSNDPLCACSDCVRIWGPVRRMPIGLK